MIFSKLLDRCLLCCKILWSEESLLPTICYRKQHSAYIPSDDSFHLHGRKNEVHYFRLHPNFLLEIKIVPDVPREMLHCPSPTVPVPTAAAALSPAPAITFTFSENPSSFATSGFSVPTTSQLSYSFGSCSSLRRRFPSFLWTSSGSLHQEEAYRMHQKHLCRKIRLKR